MRWILVLALLAASVALGANEVLAGGPPNYGVMEPTGDACPWPDFLNPDLNAAGVGKCLPTNIAWTEGDGIRIVTDPLVGSGNDAGWVNFWCETKAGFKFIVGVSGLEPNTSYPVTAPGLGTIATIRTNAEGGGVVGGLVRLPPGGYELPISVGTVLSSPADDAPGFLVFP